MSYVGTRLTADERKRQLVGIGLQLLTVTPIDEFSLDVVAEQAGISRSLLFHHFPTKRDYYLAVVAAASRRMLHYVDLRELPEPPPHGARLQAMVEALVRFIRRRRDPYLTFVRGSAGGDPAVRQINAQTRDELVGRFATELQIPGDDALRLLQLRGWLAYAEELILAWTGDHLTDEDDPRLVTLLLDGLTHLLAS
jgi:AcrR family transcriptional regulator